ncbi:MAG: hypothetical protein KBT00_04375 [Bacteroidales bacterium]|nr:hypothetical protein [Candidatus Cacconaster merdequi]
MKTGGASIKLSAASYIKDVPGPSFVIPVDEDKNPKVTVQIDSLKEVIDSNYVFFNDTTTPEIEPDTTKAGIHIISDESGFVKVTGFDYTSHWCGKEEKIDDHTVSYHGSKLITTIEFSLVSAANPNIILFGEGILFQKVCLR